MTRTRNLRIHPSLGRRTFLGGLGASALSGTALPSLVACGDDAEEAEDDSFTFIVISDTHVRLPGNPDEVDHKNQENLDHLEGVVATLNRDYPDAVCVVITGDLVGCLFSDDPADYLTGQTNPAEVFKHHMDQLAMPYYPVLGNHDYQKGYDPVLEEGIMTEDISRIEAVWNKVLGMDPYYADVVNGVRFLFLNSNRGPARTAVCETNEFEAFCTGSFDEEQLAWLEAQLTQPERCILFFHHPPFTDDPTSLWSLLPSFLVEKTDRFYEIVSTHRHRIDGMFVGHGHLWVKDTLFERIRVFETSATGDHNGDALSFHVVRASPTRGLLDVQMGNPNGRYM
jgi:hypothetical protein